MPAITSFENDTGGRRWSAANDDAAIVAAASAAFGSWLADQPVRECYRQPMEDAKRAAAQGQAVFTSVAAWARSRGTDPLPETEMRAWGTAIATVGNEIEAASCG